MEPVKEKGFRIISLCHTVYCDSQGDYHFSLICVNNGKKRYGHYECGDFFYMTHRDSREWYIELTPEARAKIHEQIAAEFDSLRVYELDRDGERRYSEYRYHDSERFRALYGPKADASHSSD